MTTKRSHSPQASKHEGRCGGSKQREGADGGPRAARSEESPAARGSGCLPGEARRATERQPAGGASSRRSREPAAAAAAAAAARATRRSSTSRRAARRSRRRLRPHQHEQQQDEHEQQPQPWRQQQQMVSDRFLLCSLAPLCWPLLPRAAGRSSLPAARRPPPLLAAAAACVLACLRRVIAFSPLASPHPWPLHFPSLPSSRDPFLVPLRFHRRHQVVRQGREARVLRRRRSRLHPSRPSGRPAGPG